MKDVLDRLKLTMEYEVIQSLLAGNDTQCFTTDQFIAARDKWFISFGMGGREALGLGPVDDGERKAARKQLSSVPSLVKQVDGDLWAMP